MKKSLFQFLVSSVLAFSALFCVSMYTVHANATCFEAPIKAPAK